MIEEPQGQLVVPRARRLGISVWLSLVALGLLAVAVVAGPWLAPQDPKKQSLLEASQGPSGSHWLGTDDLGRDIFSRTLAGARPAIEGPVVVALGVLVIAVVFGLIAGHRGGMVEASIMRVVDVLYALPAMLVIVVLVGLVGGGYWAAVAVLIFLSAPAGIRMIRSAAMSQRSLPYVESAETLGIRERRVMFVHVLPNILPTVVAGTLLDFVSALVGLSSLSFLGIGSPPGAFDWGRMLAENRTILDQNPWAAVVPAVLIIMAAASATVLGDWAYSRLSKGSNAHE